MTDLEQRTSPCACNPQRVYALVPEGWRVECLDCHAVWTEQHLAVSRRPKQPTPTRQ